MTARQPGLAADPVCGNPATEGGIGALEELCAAGVTLNVTLIFSHWQYEAARDAIWRGARRRASLDNFKSVYSIFVSRLDVYTEKACPDLSPAAQGMVGIVNAKHIWRLNQQFWADKPPYLYRAGEWGPKESDEMLARDGRQWRRP